jgi:hypothetical protein
MSTLAFAKQQVGKEMGRTLVADSKETWVCSYLSLTLLLGVGAYAVVGWWRADPVGALAIFPSSSGKDGRRWLKRASQQTTKRNGQTDRRLITAHLDPGAVRCCGQDQISRSCLRLGSESACPDPSQLGARPSEQPRDLARGAWKACRRDHGGMLRPADHDHLWHVWRAE